MYVTSWEQSWCRGSISSVSPASLWPATATGMASPPSSKVNPCSLSICSPSRTILYTFPLILDKRQTYNLLSFIRFSLILSWILFFVFVILTSSAADKISLRNKDDILAKKLPPFRIQIDIKDQEPDQDRRNKKLLKIILRLWCFFFTWVWTVNTRQGSTTVHGAFNSCKRLLTTLPANLSLSFRRVTCLLDNLVWLLGKTFFPFFPIKEQQFSR